MNHCLAFVVSLSLATAAIAADTSNTTTDAPTPPPAASVIVKAPVAIVIPETPKPPKVPATTPAKPVAAASAKPVAPATPTPATPSTTDKPAHHHHADGATTTDHHADADDDADDKNGKKHRHHQPVIDPNCGSLIVDGQGMMVGSTGCGASNIISSYPSGIIQNGYITYPPGTAFAQNGQWMICNGPLVLDTRYNRVTCEAVTVANAATIAEPVPQVPVSPPTSSRALSSDKTLRSDKNMY